MSLNKKISNSLASAGIEINGQQPWDIQVHDDTVFNRVLADGTLGLGEAYMDGLWDVVRLDQFICKALTSDIGDQIYKRKSAVLQLLAKLINMQNSSRAYYVGEQHYNAGNDLFEYMLDKRLTYTCGYWKEARDLDAAQEAKLDLVCRKLNLQAGQRILDIGSGWGSFAAYAAEHYDVSVVGITISSEQAAYANKRYAHYSCTGLSLHR